MTTYTITYYMREDHSDCGCGDDSHDHEHHHHHQDANLIGEIKELGSWAHVLPTTFLVKSEVSAADILTKLSAVVKPQDIILVSKVDENNSACSNTQVLDWVKA